MSTGQPYSSVPSANTMVANVSKVAERIRAVLRNQVASQVCSITSDGWTSGKRGNGDHYLSLTLHWIDEESQIHSAVAAAAYVPDRATAPTLEKALTQALNVYGIQPAGMHALASDRGTNIVAISRLMGIERANCTCHLLDSVTKKAIAEAGSAGMLEQLKMVQELVKGICGSSVLRRILRQTQERAGLTPEYSNGRRLAMVAKTRWSTHYRTVAVFLANFGAISDTYTARKTLPDGQSAANTALYTMMAHVNVPILRDFLQLTAPATIATSYAQGVHYVTSSSSIPMVRGIEHTVKALVARYRKTHDDAGNVKQGEVDTHPGLGVDEKLHTLHGYHFARELLAQLHSRFYAGEGTTSEHIEYSRLFAFPTLLDPAFSASAWTNQNAREAMIGELKKEVELHRARTRVAQGGDPSPAPHASLACLAIYDIPESLRPAGPGRPPAADEVNIFMGLAQEAREKASSSAKPFTSEWWKARPVHHGRGDAGCRPLQGQVSHHRVLASSQAPVAHPLPDLPGVLRHAGWWWTVRVTVLGDGAPALAAAHGDEHQACRGLDPRKDLLPMSARRESPEHGSQARAAYRGAGVLPAS